MMRLVAALRLSIFRLKGGGLRLAARAGEIAGR
jgi:hypothetical protein